MVDLVRRRLLTQLPACLMLASLPGCLPIQMRPLKVAMHKWPGYEFMFYAAREELLDSQQVTLTETNSATQSLSLLKQADIDGAALTLDEVLLAASHGIGLTVVLVCDISAGADMVLAKPGVLSHGTLIGSRIGVEQGALGALMFNRFLNSFGLSARQLRLIPKPVDQQEAAWQAGELDLVVSYPPVAQRLMQQGAVRLFDSRALPNLIVDVLAIKTALLSSHMASIRHLIAGHFQVLDYLHRNPQDASYRMAGHLALPAAEVLFAFRGLELPSLYRNYQLLGGAQPELQSGLDQLHQLMLDEQLFVKANTSLHLLSGDFLPDL